METGLIGRLINWQIDRLNILASYVLQFVFIKKQDFLNLLSYYYLVFKKYQKKFNFSS